MALARNTPRTLANILRRNSLALAANTLVYEGAAVGVSAATGRGRPLVAGDLFAGFAAARATSQADAQGAAPTEVQLASHGEIVLAVPGVAAASVGASVFATDDATFALTGTSLIGSVLRVPSAGMAVVAFDALRPSLPSSAVSAALSLVSEAGNVTSAAIRSTTGTPGQIVKLADGDDKGMLLQWLIPAGSTTYAWCWFLSPNDAY